MRVLRAGLLPALLVILMATGSLLVADTVPADATVKLPPVYHGNVQSHIYHRQSCRFFDCKACTATFMTREDAEKAGFRPCKVCKP